jgi:5'-nucleotidase
MRRTHATRAQLHRSGHTTATQNLIDKTARVRHRDPDLRGRGGDHAMTARTRMVTLIGAMLLLIGPSAVGARTTESAPEKDPSTKVQLLAINDFHGNLQPPFLRPTGTLIGGVEFLATHLERLEATNPNTLVVSAGDLIGASPLLSGLFHDEPTIESANLFGLDFNAVGNHEFDEGVTELLRMQEGGCHPVDGCQDGTPFLGADFKFLAANVKWKDGSGTIFPPYKVVKFDGTSMALIGMTLEDTPSIVSPSGIQDVSFHDEADTVNALIPKLRRKGIETIVVLVHEGGFPSAFDNTCPGISGPIVDIVNRTSDHVDLFITGHTHQAYNCVIDGRPVTSAYQFGGMVTDIDMEISRATGNPVGVSVNNRLVTRDVPADSAQTELIAHWNTFAAEFANRVVGSITADILRANNAAGESALGDRIADAQLWATRDIQGAQIAFMNPGGIRADLVHNNQAAGEAPGEVTFGEVFAVQPFQNTLVTMNVTGAQIDTLLEQQFDNPSPGANRVLQVPEGFTYTWDAAAPTGNKVDPATIQLNGTPIDPNGTYRITVNSFLADGGDNFRVLSSGTDRFSGAVDSEVFADYVGAHSPLTPGPQNRITRIN